LQSQHRQYRVADCVAPKLHLHLLPPLRQPRGGSSGGGPSHVSPRHCAPTPDSDVLYDLTVSQKCGSTPLWCRTAAYGLQRRVLRAQRQLAIYMPTGKMDGEIRAYIREDNGALMHDADEYPIRLHCFSDTSLRDLICRRVMSSHISQWVEACECRNPCSLRSCSSTLSAIGQKFVCTTRVPPMESCNLPRVTSSRLAYYARHERRTSCRHLMRLLVHAPAEGTTSLLSRSFLLTTNTLNLLAFDLGFHYCTRGVRCLISTPKHPTSVTHFLFLFLSTHPSHSLLITRTAMNFKTASSAAAAVLLLANAQASTFPPAYGDNATATAIS